MKHKIFQMKTKDELFNLLDEYKDKVKEQV